MKLLRILSFGTLFLLIAVLAVATVCQQVYGAAFAARVFYGAPWFVALWALAAVAGLVYLFRSRVCRRPAVFLLHISLAVILAGALATHLFGQQGTLHLRVSGGCASSFTGNDGRPLPLPFGVSLTGFRIDCYPGTQAPMDYVSSLTLTDGDRTFAGRVSMNRICSHRHYRFFQSGYDADGQGTTLAVSYDPWGIGITHAGYLLMALAWIIFFVSGRTTFRALLRHPALQRGAMLFLMVAALPLQTFARPGTLPREQARAFGRLYVYYNDRICPLQTLARDFTVKLYGSDTYQGLTAEQVFTGWLFFYDDWKNEPFIRVRDKAVRRLLGVDGSYVRLSDFVDRNGYKLDSALSLQSGSRGVARAHEAFTLAGMVTTGRLLRIYPCPSDTGGPPRWYSPADRLPSSLPSDEWLFVRKSLALMAGQVAGRQWEDLDSVISGIRRYQHREAVAVLPSDARFKAELCYNRMLCTGPLAWTCLSVGLLAFVLNCRRMALGIPLSHRHTAALLFPLAGVLAWLCILLALRGYVSGHWPLSNGYETMQFMAACTAALTLLLGRRQPLLAAMGWLVCGLSLLVSLMGQSDPPVTPLMPVLASPLLSVHVASVMLAYTLLAFVTLGGVAALILHAVGKGYDSVVRLHVWGRLLLYPAVALLAVGIFIGAVWAGVSWGRYWGWDPKEVWALITLLVYAVPLHGCSFPAFCRRPLFFHAYVAMAFLCVLVTYFGVNFLMDGLHSYV